MNKICVFSHRSIYGKINLNQVPQNQEIQQPVDELCEDYKDIFSLHQGDIGYTELLTMDIV